MVWTLVDAVSAYALVKTWRARSGAGKGKRDTLVAASYVPHRRPRQETNGLLSFCQLPVQPIPVPPITGVLNVVDVEHAPPTEHHVRCTWSVDIQSNVDLSITNIIYRPGKTSPALFCLAALVHVSLSSVLLVLPVIMLLLGQPRSGLANPKPISVDFKRGRIISLEFLVHFATLSLTSSLVSGGFQWMWKTWFVEYVFVILLSIARSSHARFPTDFRSPI